MTRLTVLLIQTSDARVEVVKCKKGWQGLIVLWKNGSPHTTLLSTEEGAYPSKRAGIEGMNGIMDEIKNFNLNAS